MLKECPICLDEQQLKRQCEQCKWTSCDKCAMTWAQHSKFCPQCRARLHPDDPHPNQYLQTRLHNLNVCLKLIFLFVDTFFVLVAVLGLNFILDEGMCHQTYSNTQCISMSMMVIFIFISAVCTMRYIVRKWILSCCSLNLDIDTFQALQEHSSDENRV